jgi:hypothetical protein
MKKLYDIQPSECRKPLIAQTLNSHRWSKLSTRLFNFDPTSIYDRINEHNMLNPFKRQHTVSMKFLFLNENGLCACGCGIKLEGRKKRWASKECSDFAFSVFSVISSRIDSIRTYRSIYIGGYACEVCGDKPIYEPVELDHLIPVKYGGGGGWLSNYQFKCRSCHRKKTNKDFGFKQNK